MARGSKTGGRDFTPGQSGNPSGRPLLPEDIKQARTLTKLEFERIANRYLFEPISVLSEVLQRPETPAIEALVVKIIMAAGISGDHQRLDFLLDRLIGKVPAKVDATLDIAHLSEPEFLRELKDAISFIESKQVPSG